MVLPVLLCAMLGDVLVCKCGGMGNAAAAKGEVAARLVARKASIKSSRRSRLLQMATAAGSDLVLPRHVETGLPVPFVANALCFELSMAEGRLEDSL